MWAIKYVWDNKAKNERVLESCGVGQYVSRLGPRVLKWSEQPEMTVCTFEEIVPLLRTLEEWFPGLRGDCVPSYRAVST
jgi:hypothetical protein